MIGNHCFLKQLNTNQGRFVLTSSGDLQIVQLHRTDSGTYVCIADNGVGEPVLREVKLQVNGKYPTPVKDALFCSNYYLFLFKTLLKFVWFL